MLRVEFDGIISTLESLHFEYACTEPCDARPSQFAVKDTGKKMTTGMKRTAEYIPGTSFHSTKSSTRKCQRLAGGICR